MVDVGVSYSDDRGLDLATFALVLDGATIGGVTPGANDASRVLGPVADGSHVLVASIKDLAGHPAQDQVSFTVDTAPPQIAILQPGNGTVTGDGTITVSGTVSDASAVTVQVEGIVVPVVNGTFTTSVVPGAGPNVTLHAVARDAAGNESTATVTVRIDRTPPVVHLTQPVSGAYVRGPILDVRGTYSDETPVTIEVNGQPAPAAGAFAVAVPVPDGPIALTATAHDAAGNAGSDTRSVIVDSIAPVITVTSPESGFLSNGTSVHVAGTVTDASPATLRLGSTLVPVSGGSFEIDAPLAGEGPTTLHFSATDAAGNTGTLDSSITVDRTPPVVQVVQPTCGGLIGAVPVVLQGSVSDASATTVTVDGFPATVTQQAWQALFAFLPEGPRTFTILATDAAGNQASLSCTVLVELTPPAIAITQPSAGSSRETQPSLWPARCTRSAP